jgi:hypothetical protein
MSKLISRVLAVAFVLGIAAALAFGAQAAFASGRALSCPCDPVDPGADAFCIACCHSDDSLCPPGAGGERECLCGG